MNGNVLKNNYRILPMTLQEKKNISLWEIFWSEFCGYPIGICQTGKGISHIHFIDSRESFLSYIADFFPNAHILEKGKRAFLDISEQTFHIFATPFQWKVFHELVKIPFWDKRSYEDIAKNIGKPAAYRAVWTAIGNNEIAFFIPCHRVIQKSGKFGGYRWGIEKKSVLLAWESQKKGV